MVAEQNTCELTATVRLWDVEGGLAGARASAVAERLVQGSPELVVATHAIACQRALSSEVSHVFGDAGYVVHEPSGETSDGERLVVLVNNRVNHEARTVRLAGSAALLVELEGPDFLAMQFSNRGSAARQAQAEAALSEGPFSRLREDTVAALGAGIVRVAAPRVFASPIIKGVWERMGGGLPAEDAATMKLWKRAGFRAANGGRTVVRLPNGAPAVQLGGIFVRGETAVPKVVTGENHFLTRSRPLSA